MSKIVDPEFTEKEFEKFTNYCNMTNNSRFDKIRAKIIGIPAKNVMVATGASVRSPFEQIGENTYIGIYSYINGNVTIGKNVLIGPRCSLTAGNHKYDPKTGYFSARDDKTIKVEDGCWLASNVTVTPGVTLGRCTLCCAGAVITKSTKPFSIMAGVPAKQIGKIDEQTGEYHWFK